jgi:hypothetical protein
MLFERIALAHVIGQRRRFGIARTLPQHGASDVARAVADDPRDAVALQFENPAFRNNALKNEIVLIERELHARLLLARTARERLMGFWLGLGKHEARCGCGKWFFSRGVPAPRTQLHRFSQQT